MSTSVSPSNLSPRYHRYAMELFAEAMKYYGPIISDTERPRGQLIITLERLICALREEPFRVDTEYERRVKLRAMELLDVADQAVNGSDTTEGRAKLFQLVYQLRNIGDRL